MNKIDQRKKELTDAALAGIREFLRSTRGAALCGAGAAVLKDDDGTVTVYCHKSQTEHAQFGFQINFKGNVSDVTFLERKHELA